MEMGILDVADILLPPRLDQKLASENEKHALVWSSDTSMQNVMTGTSLLPWKPLGVFLPWVVSLLPVPQSPITVVAFDVVTMTCEDAAAEWNDL